MRIWDIGPAQLCRKHLLGEHRELHALWSILQHDKRGYRNHPETKRWEGKLPALFQRHEDLVVEMERRGYKHQSPLVGDATTGERMQQAFLHSVVEQERILREKNCGCFVRD